MHLNKILIKQERFPTEEHYPFNLAVLQQTNKVQFERPVTFFVGENGSGKSTLLRAIAQKCGIHIWRDELKTRYAPNPFENRLFQCVDVEWDDGIVPGSFFGSEIFHDFTRLVDEWSASDPGQLKYFGGESLVTMSHGESLMAFFQARYKIKGLHLLDEPETALSPRRLLQLLDLLVETSKHGNVQFIIATHSPILLACPDAQIFSFDRVSLETIQYQQTEHFRLYYDFLNKQKKLISQTDIDEGND